MASRSFKQAVAAGAAALVLGGAALGAVSAQQATPTPASPPAQVTPARPPQGAAGQNPQQSFLTALAAKLGIGVDKLQQAIDQVRQEQGLPPGKGFPGGHRGGPGGEGPGHRGGPGHLDAAAQAMGITPDQLRQELPGKSLTDVAKAHNVDPKKVSDALKADEASRIDQAVKDGRLTADQATQKKAEEATEVDQQMTQTFPSGGFGPGRLGGPGRPGPAGTPGAQQSGFGPGSSDSAN